MAMRPFIVLDWPYVEEWYVTCLFTRLIIMPWLFAKRYLKELIKILDYYQLV